MLIDDLLERNRNFVLGRQSKPLPKAESVSLAVIGCFDPRLDALLRPALGLADGEGFMLRTAGAVLTPGSHTLRSLAVAVYLFEVDLVLIVGHSSCRMADFPTAQMIDGFRRRGVSRDAFGEGDLRVWAGATASPRAGVLATAAAIRDAPYLPRDLGLAGAVLDDASGALEMILRPGEPLPGRVPGAVAAGSKAAAAQPEVAPPPPATAGGTPPIPPEALHPSLGELRATVDRLVAGGKLDDLRRLRSAIETEVYPANKLALLQRFVQRAAGESPAVQQAFALLARQVQGAGHDLAGKTLGELFAPLLGHPAGGRTDSGETS